MQRCGVSYGQMGGGLNEVYSDGNPARTVGYCLSVVTRDLSYIVHRQQLTVHVP